MAEKKNFTIENYNGTDYDTLYPETHTGQVKLDLASKAELGLVSDGLDDALAKLNNFDDRYQIGDTIVTTRTNLGNKWLLCNGATVNANDYPELSQYFDANILRFDKCAEYPIDDFNRTQSFSFDVRPIPLTSTDGILMFSVYTPASDESSKRYVLAYKRVDDDAWTDCKGSGVNNALYYDTKIQWLNDVFVVLPCFSTYTVGNNPAYYCTGAPTSSASFSQIATPSVGTDCSWGHGIYWNNKYYIVGVGDSRTNSYLFVYDNLGTTPESILLTTKSAVSKDITIVNNKLCIRTTHSGNKVSFVLIDTNNAIENVTITLDASLTSEGTIWGDLYKLGNNYIFTTRYSNTTTLKVANSLSSTFTQFKTYTNASEVTFLQKSNMLISSMKDYITEDLTINPWQNASSISATNVSCMATSKNYDYIGFNHYDFWRSSNSSTFTLPTSSPGDGMYRYIKALN